MTQHSDQTGQRVTAIAAVADNGVIGTDRGMPWRISEDFKRFRKVTMGGVLVLGRTTYEGHGALDGRWFVVLTRDRSWRPAEADADRVQVAYDLTDALAKARATGREIFVSGGGEIYRQAWPHLTDLDLTEVHQSPEGDTYFPAIDPQEWAEVAREPREGFDWVLRRRR
ncbi:dihydrofolate reductase [Parenemella sanctibonifatiensis]|uniref:Dihydrofolate reductase n=1 Tax=Parenemella sanctibonifatiensis TaxID=2016505 RepID=A0A255EEL8_9ACTN|nr:dihydrofolate reductase [Parenemella sanctibonifatiensis]OYN87842.1 diacylglycerol kinase [Parenemella sanctibonifatiensis]